MEKKPSESLQDRLAGANQKVDAQLPDIWQQAEKNLKSLEEDYYNNQINKGIRD
ncbi:hypothetical protein [Paenibacillus sinopodophylli]|uniref:hypothetical protein n=1 Tax=Paenibacillus sinopodophylli TaxID=1837342 RepID=UPI0014861A39|nr:hypothetical protein [Paenibacillus sinopodophylli]